MRLRLRIERNGLPPVSILWPVSDPNQSLTVGQLLHLIDEKIPLEGDTWGLEDYAVLIGGYEALHYNELGSVCKDEDEVVIRALQWRDRKMRLLAGRDQISVDGRHLVDGVPFGRPLIARAVRPDIKIPPLKKLKTNHKMEAALSNMLVPRAGPSEEEGPALYEDENTNYSDADEHDSEDGSFEADDSEASVDVDGNSNKNNGASNIHANNHYLNPLDRASASDSDSDADSRSDSDSDSDLDQDSDSESDSSNSDSESDSGGSSVSFNSIEAEPTRPELSLQCQQSKMTKTSNIQGLNHGMATRSQETVTAAGLPFQGKETTQNRNQRRRESKKLKFLKDQGMLPPETTLEGLRHWERENGVGANQTIQTDTTEKETFEAARQTLLRSIASGGIDVTPGSHSSRVNENMQLTKDEDSPPEELTSTNPEVQSSIDRYQQMKPTLSNLENGDFTRSSNAARQEASHTRTSRVDTANRLIFGSLGVRAPKSQGEASALQAKLQQRSLHGTKPSNIIQNEARTSGQPNQVEDKDDEPDAWQQKLIISAIECCDKGITLTAPPFPFRQRWDSHYQGKRKNHDSTEYITSNKRRKWNKAGESAQETYTETYDKYNKVHGDALNYDDAEESSDQDDSYWEEGALLGDEDVEENVSAADQQLLAETAAIIKSDGFPPLPTDTSTLARLDASDAAKGDFVVYEELACSAATNWQPNMVIRTIRLDERSDEGWAATVAVRDLAPKNYDDEGQRVYAKFEMGGFSDNEDEEDDRTRIIRWDELKEPRLLQRSTPIN